MGRTDDKDFLLKNVHGRVGKTLVIKQYDYGTVISKFPNMSRVKRTARQKTNSGRFKQAVAYAKSILYDPQKRAAFEKKLKKKKPKGRTSVYHAAIKEFLSNHP